MRFAKQNQGGHLGKPPLQLGLDQWVSNEGNVASKGHLAVSGDTFDCQDRVGRRVQLGSNEQRLWVQPNILQYPGQARTWENYHSVHRAEPEKAGLEG